MLHGSAVPLPGSARNTHGIKNTTEGVVRMCCTGLLSLYQAVQGTHTVTYGLKNTPEGVVRMCCTDLLFLCKDHTHGIKNTPGVL